MATDQSKQVAKLLKYISNLKAFLRKQDKFQRNIANNVRRLKRRSPVGGPTVTDPPKPPFKP